MTSLALVRWPLDRPGLIYNIIQWNDIYKKLNRKTYLINDRECFVFKIGTLDECRKYLDKLFDLFLLKRNEIHRSNRNKRKALDDEESILNKRIRLE